MPVRAAGGVLWRPAPDGPEVAVVHRPRYDDWSLPKGKVDPGEHPLAAAVREVGEETGHDVVVGPYLGATSYDVLVGGRAVPKAVDWWALRCAGGAFVPGEEVDALRWLPVPRARELVVDGHLLHDLPVGLPAPLVLLRHAQAGRRRDWTGDDALRPLDARGRRQAARLAELLPLHDVRALVAAPPLRCVQTLEPLAERLGLPVEVSPLLSDAGQAAQPDDALALLRAASPGTVVCSQGDALPALSAALGGPAGPVRKGTARVLWRTDGVLRAADLLDPEERRPRRT